MMVETNLPVLFLRDVVLLPYNELRIEFSKEYEKMILDISERRHDNHILFVNLVDSLVNTSIPINSPVLSTPLTALTPPDLIPTKLIPDSL